MSEQFVIDNLQYVFGIDALDSSRPINYPVETPDQINQMFDAISYEKGASILRMCANFMGPENFRKGISYYVRDKYVT